MNETADLKQIATTFLQLASSGNVDEAYDLVAAGFRHHNPYFASDAESLKIGMRENALHNPNRSFEIQRTIGEGSFVAVHSRVEMRGGAVTIAVVHIFRFENGRIAELWDVGQPLPDNVVNEIGMF